MATITECDICKRKGSIAKINKWFMLSFGEGFFAVFDKKVKYEVCEDCYSDLMSELRERTK